MSRMLTIAAVVFGFSVAPLLSGCGGLEYTKITVRAKGEVSELCAGDHVNMRFRLYALDDEGRNAVQDEIDPALVAVWTSDNEDIATVDAEGVVTMNALGVATVTLSMETPSGTMTDSLTLSACDCLAPVTDPTRQMEAIVTAPPVGSPTARMRVRCPKSDAESGGSGCASYSGTVCWHEAIPESNTNGRGTWQTYHCADGRIERREEGGEWSVLHTEPLERHGPGPYDESGAPAIPGCSAPAELEAVDLRGGQPDDFYRCRCNS